ncbi:motility associated factor glycosyltransferase family protein [Exiguobacterium undae]
MNSSKKHIKILDELKNISKNFNSLTRIKAWDTLNEIAKMVQIFGAEINSNGVSTEKELYELLELSKANTNHFSKALKENLDLLIVEYNELIKLPVSRNLTIRQFEHTSKKMAIIKSENFIKCLSEDELLISKVLNNISANTQTVILLGTGTNELIAEISLSYEVIGIEPCNVSVEQKVKNCLYLEDNDFYEKLKQHLIECVGLSTTIVLHPSYQDVPGLSNILKVIKNLLNATDIELNTRILNTESWYQQAFLNHRTIEEKIDSVINMDLIKDKHKGEHALMIASGPSLEEALPHLKKLQHSHRIIAIGQSVKALLNNDIYPDYVVSTDTHENNYHFFKGIHIEIPLVFSMQVNHKIPKNTNGLLIPLNDTSFNGMLLPFLKTKSFTASTVAISAVMFGHYLGFDSIGLVGQDLALRNNEYYSQSVKNNALNDGQLSEDFYNVELNNGEIGKTTPVLFSFLENYQSVFRLINDLEKRLYNVSKCGAKIGDVIFRPIDQISAKDKKNKVIFNSSEYLSHEDKKNKFLKQNRVLEIFKESENILCKINHKLSKIIEKKVVTEEEYREVIKEMDKFLDNKVFSEIIVPLQIVQILSTQNKSRILKSRKSSSDERMQIVYLIKNVIGNILSFQKKIETTKEIKYS